MPETSIRTPRAPLAALTFERPLTADEMAELRRIFIDQRRRLH